MEKVDTAQSVEKFSYLVREYPVSPQARGALYEIGLLGEKALRNQLEEYIDSAVADTARIAAEKDRVRAEAAAMAAASLDSSATSPAAPDSLGTAADTLGSVVVDSLVTVPSPSDSAEVDSAGAGGASAVDTTKAPPIEQIKRDATYPLDETVDTTGTRNPPQPSAEKREQSENTSSSGAPERGENR
jgi:hypothetical protein